MKKHPRNPACIQETCLKENRCEKNGDCRFVNTLDMFNGSQPKYNDQWMHPEIKDVEKL